MATEATLEPEGEPKPMEKQEKLGGGLETSGMMVEDGYPDQSPVEEVALTVSTADDPTMRSLTWRTFVIGIIVCGGLAFVNQYFWFRQASIIINPIAATVLSLYLGRFAASVQRMFDPSAAPFNIKEHVLISIFAQSGSAYGNGNAYAVDIVTIMKQFYGVDVSFIAALMLISTTQVLGYGFAGLLRRYLVEPANMWWPYNLVFVSLFRTLHEPDKPPKGSLTRFHFFFLVLAVSFAWYAVPDYLIPIVTSISWVCWAWPNSITAQQIGGGVYGLGLGAFPLDWATISAFLGSPLASPWFATANVAVGFFVACYIIAPAIYWTNTYESQRFPILTSTLFQYEGTRYPTRSLLTPEVTLNETAYNEVGHPWLSGYFAMGYGFGFAALTASVVHVALWNGYEIVARTMSAIGETAPDVHTRMMRRYPRLPEWWFTILLAISLALAIVCLEVFKYFQLPWWGLLFAAVLSFIFTLPIGTISATTNQTPGLNIITEMIWGYIRPGEPISNVCFKTYGYISMTQALSFLSDFKLGTYMKIPPRNMFVVQVSGTLLAGVVNLGVAFWLFGAIEGGNICQTDKLPGNSPWTCPSANVFYSASIIWGLVGPARMWSIGQYYGAMNWFWIIGALAPLPFWVAYKYLPKQKWLAKVNTPIVFSSIGLMPPAGPVNYIGWITVGFIFNKLVFTYRKDWWKRYNYLLSAALDAGVMFMSLLVFFGSQVQNPAVSLTWWGAGGNTLDQCDLVKCPTACGVTSSYAWCPTPAGCPVA